MEPIVDICVICEKEIERVTHKNRKRSFCSLACRSEDYKRKQIKKECGFCKTPYETTAAKDRFSRYCSVICYRKYKSRSGEWIEKECEYCNEKFGFKKMFFRSASKRFCSSSCTGKYAKSPKLNIDE
jgi:hypothetical protein